MSYQSPNSPSEGEVIHITADDAGSAHVDDLLRRHASLRGEQGITRDRGRKWYYQNWFIFSIAGILAALAGYALLNPFFDDRLYASGVIKAIDDHGQSPMTIEAHGQQKTLELVGVTLDQERFLVLVGHTRWRKPNGKYANFDLKDLKVGQHIGAYITEVPEGSSKTAVAEFLVPDPKPQRRDGVALETQASQQFAAQLLLFPTIAAFVGLFIAAADGIMCRLFRRVVLAGLVGLAIGFVGGFISKILAEMIYGPISHFAMKQGGSLGFALQTGGRGLAWAVAGMTMGLGQGIALRSKRLTLYGFLGGMVGGLLGGLLFDPIDMLLLGTDKPSAQVSRWIGFAVIGAVVGLMIGIVERLARDAWLRMVEGPLSGKEFLVFKDIMRMGSSPRSEIYLFNDREIAPEHAVIRATGDIYEIENSCRESPVCVNGRPVTRARLRHGDRISLGRTAFVFQRQRGQ